MSHGNARLTFHGRLLIVQRRQAGWKQAHIAAAMGVSRKCVRTWIDRYAAEGEAGLADRPSRPRSMPTKTSPEAEARVLELRLSQRRGQDWLGPELGLAPRTVSRILRRHQLPYLRHCDPMTGEVIRSSKSTAVRYERERPGELIHMDVKKLGRIPDEGGWRGRGETVGNHQARIDKTPIGYDFVHSAIDDCSRLAYSEIHADEKAQTCAAFFARAIEYFAAHGVTRIERLMTDNAFAYRHGSALRELCAAHGIKHIFIRPHCPWQNGKVERLNRTLTSEWAYRRPFRTNTERAEALAPWIEHYNTQRRHSALGRLPPVSRLLPT
jgi:transposase InsO family protein